VHTAVYLLNRSPTKALNAVTPYEAWYGEQPYVHHLRTFGCIGHVKDVHPHLKKLADRSTPMVLLGYESGARRTASTTQWPDMCTCRVTSFSTRA